MRALAQIVADLEWYQSELHLVDTVQVSPMTPQPPGRSLAGPQRYGRKIHAAAVASGSIESILPPRSTKRGRPIDTAAVAPAGYDPLSQPDSFSLGTCSSAWCSTSHARTTGPMLEAWASRRETGIDNACSKILQTTFRPRTNPIVT